VQEIEFTLGPAKQKQREEEEKQNGHAVTKPCSSLILDENHF
jgi:hypothetical protein